MSMTLYVFKFLSVVCLLLSLALLWRLDWFPVLAPWEIRSKRERDWVRSPFMFLAIPTSRSTHGLRNEMRASKLSSTKRLDEPSCSPCFLGFQGERSSASLHML